MRPFTATRSSLVEVCANSFSDGWQVVDGFFLGKTIREGMGQATNRSSSECLDLVITNALILDWSGIYKVFYPAPGSEPN
jgi:urease alpha subunit